MFSNTLSLEQRQILSSKQIQSLEILACTNQELENILLNEYLENPILENSHDKQNDMIKNLETLYEKNTSYKDHYIKWADDDCKYRNDIQALTENEITDFLMGQLHKTEYSSEQWKLMKYLTYCLDEEGFFTYEVSEISKVSGASEQCISDALNVLKNLEPIGIFSADISECLQKQMNASQVTDEKLHSIVAHHMGDILQGRIGTVSRTLGLSTARVREYIHYIGTLNPRPIMSLGKDNTQYIIPDILITFEKNTWDVIINDNWMGEYKYNDYYLRMMEESKDEELTQYFKEKLERARFILNCVEQRRSTIIKIIYAILELQEDFFLKGTPLKPMCMEDVAKRTNLHVSTVSRAIKDKYLQYRHTIFIKDLFTTTAFSSQEDVSIGNIKQHMQEIIAEEDKQKPLSDLKIAALMQERQIDISRRTVTKYRKQLGIPESRQRVYLNKP